MISDVLFEAHANIRRYLDDADGLYTDHEFRQRMERLLGEMDAMRQELDKPPDADEQTAKEIQEAMTRARQRLHLA